MKNFFYLLLTTVFVWSCQQLPITPIPNTPENGGEAYDSKKTVVLEHDTARDNFLVRGNEPLLDNGYSAYNQINEELKNQIDSNFDLKNYIFIDISLISSQPNTNTPPNERFILFDEIVAFGYPLMDTLNSLNLNPPLGWPPYLGYNLNPKQAPWNPNSLYGNKIQVSGNLYNGQFVWWPIQACGDTLQDCLDIVENQYGFSELLDLIHSLMTENTKTVIYFHCIHGHDRTSVVNAGYIIRHKGISFYDATHYPAPIGGMKPTKDGYDPLKQPYWNMLYVWNKNSIK